MADSELPSSPFTRRVLFGGVAVIAQSAAAADARKKKKRRKKRRKQQRHDGVATPIGGSPSSFAAIRPSRWTQAEQDRDVRAAYDRWKTHYLISEAGSQYRVAFSRSGSGRNQTVSEGQGFGLMIVASMAAHDPAARAICEGLWRFSRAHPSQIDPRLMDWNVPDASGNDSAFDGDADLAYGLLLADAAWGSGGAVNFRAEFDRTIAAIKASTIGPQSWLPMLGDWVQPDGGTYNQYTPRTSDLMTGHFRTWARVTGDRDWNQVVVASQQTISTLQADFSLGAGLLPDFVQPRSAQDNRPRPASPRFLEGANDGNYFYNAGRCPWRIGADAILHGDATSAAQAARIARWAAAATDGSPLRIRAGYHLDGTPIAGSDYFSLLFVAPIGVAAMCDGALQTWLDDIYATIVATTDQDYYEESVALLCLLLMTGNFRRPDQ